MSKITIDVTGYLGKDPELKETQSGSPFIKFSLAASTGNGNDKQTIWFDCALFGKRAQSLAGLLHKGKYVVVNGSLKESKWTDQNGQQRTSLQINVNDIDLGPADHQGQQGAPQVQQSATVYAGPEYGNRPAGWGGQPQAQGGFQPPNQGGFQPPAQGGFQPPNQGGGRQPQGGYGPQNQGSGWTPPDDIPF